MRARGVDEDATAVLVDLGLGAGVERPCALHGGGWAKLVVRGASGTSLEVVAGGGDDGLVDRDDGSSSLGFLARDMLTRFGAAS